MTGLPDRAGGFRVDYRVRFDEAGPDGALRVSGLLRYTQDAAARHSEALGYDRAWYAARGLTWLVRTAEVDVDRAIGYGTDVAATTRVLGFRRVWSRRETTFELPDGSPAATVRIDWVLLDERGSPARIPAEFERVFPAPPARLQLARVDLGEPPADAIRRSFTVRPQELDPMGHVNNAAYADWLEEAVGEAATAGVVATGSGPGGPAGRALPVGPRRVRLEYARAAEPGEGLDSLTWHGDGWSSLVTRTADGAELLRARIETTPGNPGASPR